MAVAYTLLHAVLHGDGAAPLSDAMAAKLRRSVDLWYAVIPPPPVYALVRCRSRGSSQMPRQSNPSAPPLSLSQSPCGRT